MVNATNANTNENDGASPIATIDGPPALPG